VNTRISAIEHLRPLRGGAQSHLLRASDGNCYVTKFQNNPQHIRVLANEMLATRLGRVLGLRMPKVEVIEVPDWLIVNIPDLRIQLAGREIPCQSGRQLGSLISELAIPWDALITCPASCSRECAILRTSLGYLFWTSGRATAMDGRQSSFVRRQKAGGIPQLSLTRATALMAASGRFRTPRFEVHTRTTAYTRVSRGGNHLSQHSLGQRRWMLPPFGGAQPIFPKSGTKATGPVWNGWWKCSVIDGLRSGN
jgi:hypothetical protein